MVDTDREVSMRARVLRTSAERIGRVLQFTLTHGKLQTPERCTVRSGIEFDNVRLFNSDFTSFCNCT